MASHYPLAHSHPKKEEGLILASGEKWSFTEWPHLSLFSQQDINILLSDCMKELYRSRQPTWEGLWFSSCVCDWKISSLLVSVTIWCTEPETLRNRQGERFKEQNKHSEIEVFGGTRLFWTCSDWYSEQFS